MAPPSTAKKVSRGTPSRSAQIPQTRVSSTSVSPTSKTTALTVTWCGAGPSPGAFAPRGPAQRLARQLLGPLAGPLVDLLHTAQVEPVHEDRRPLLRRQRPIPVVRHRVDDRHEHLGAAVE